VHTTTSLIIKAPREKIFAVVSDLARWPELLPHYRYIKFLRRDGVRDVVEMAARRDFIPIRWVSAYEAHRESLELRFEHLRAWTKGMRVVWTLTAVPEGTRVEIVHDLRFRISFLQWLAEPIIGGFFINPIARKTLRSFKAHLET